MLVVMAARVLRLISLALGLFMLAVVAVVRIQLEELAVLAVQEMVEQPLLGQPLEPRTRVAVVVVCGRRGLQQQAAPVS
jgi:hypothetical protein